MGLFLIEFFLGGWVFGQSFGTLVIPKDFTRHYDVSELYGGVNSKYVRDKHGLRGAYVDVSRIDILTIGGSTTNEIFISEGRTWNDQLRSAFRESGRDLVIVNAGVDGQSTIGHLKNFELWFPKIPKLKARYILAYIGINDYGVVLTGYHSKQDNMEAPQRKVKRYLINNSVLYTLFRNLRGIWRAKKANLIHNSNSYDGTNWQLAAQQPSLDVTLKDLGLGVNEYRHRLSKLIKVIRAFGAKPIIVTQHLGKYRIRDGKVWGKASEDGTVDISAYAGLSALSFAAMATCKKARAICIDLANELFFVDGDHYDGVHTTPKGSKKISQYLYKKLEKIIQ
jgi:lysophospholipase L1-like esterase